MTPSVAAEERDIIRDRLSKRLDDLDARYGALRLRLTELQEEEAEVHAERDLIANDRARLRDILYFLDQPDPTQPDPQSQPDA